MGRVIKEESGDGTVTKSVMDTEYDRFPCSPLCKVKRVSQPYLGDAPATDQWTTYTYDCFGRPLTITHPGSSGTTT